MLRVVPASSGPDEGIGAVRTRDNPFDKNKAKPAEKVKTSFGFYRTFTGCFFVPALVKSTVWNVLISSLFAEAGTSNRFWGRWGHSLSHSQKLAEKVKTSFRFYQRLTRCFVVPALVKSTGWNVLISSLFADNRFLWDHDLSERPLIAVRPCIARRSAPARSSPASRSA